MLGLGVSSPMISVENNLMSRRDSKANVLEIWGQIAESFSLIHTRSIYGKVEMLEKLRPPESKTDHLFIGTDRYMYFTVFWDQQRGQLQTKRVFSNQADKTSRKSQTQDRCQIDPTKAFMALLLFDGIVNILPMSQSSKKKASSDDTGIGEPVPARISEFFVRSATFLHSRPKDKQRTKLALLFEDNHQRVCISVRALDFSVGINGELGSADLESLLGTRGDLELGASHLIPVPAPACMSMARDITNSTPADASQTEFLCSVRLQSAFSATLMRTS